MMDTAMATRHSTAGVQVLKREPNTAMVQATPIKRVAAYCRVSTDMEQQATSLETQMESFRFAIAAHPGWELGGIYADEGLTGTNASHRVEFQKMIADCEEGKIDRIITKSISRFARNTMDCLQYVRKLKDLGIYVYFEDNHLDTGRSSSEMLLTILAAVAQEESHSISENMKWSMRKRFQAGQPKWVKTYGFIKGEDGTYHIYEEQAKGVRRIFELYANGYSLLEMVKMLDAESIPSMTGGKWWPKTLATVLHNEKYVGDIMMQKSYTVDHLTHRKVVNDQTVVPSYYVRDHHEAIVDRRTYDLVQTILSLKNPNKGTLQYPYAGFLTCPLCGEKMACRRSLAQGNATVWTCGDPLCEPYAIHAKLIDRIMKEAYAMIDVTELDAIGAKTGPKADAARAAKAWKSRLPSLTKIDYILLYDLVRDITFMKDWRRAVVRWKFGGKSSISVEFGRAMEKSMSNENKQLSGKRQLQYFDRARGT